MSRVKEKSKAESSLLPSTKNKGSWVRVYMRLVQTLTVPALSHNCCHPSQLELVQPNGKALKIPSYLLQI